MPREWQITRPIPLRTTAGPFLPLVALFLLFSLLMTTSKILSAVALLSLASPLAEANPAASRLRAEGSEQEYNLRLDQAFNCFNQAVTADPDDPASYRAVAAAYLMKIAFHRGAVTTDDFLGGEVKADAIDMPKPPADMALGFHKNAERALQLAEQQVRARPKDADGHFQLGAAIALLASYSATVDGQVFSAFSFARRAYKENSRALELDPQRHDAGLVVGAYQYVVSTRSLPIRWLGRIAGLDGNKARGIALIEAAARYPGENQTDARLALVVIYNREHRYDDALAVLSDLEVAYPGNDLLWLEAGATALRAGRFQEAKRMLDEGLSKRSDTSTVRAFGEDALWNYKRGASLVGLHQVGEATSALKTALRKEARDWVRGRAHAELGKLADLSGDRAAARQEYRLAVDIAKAADDSIGSTEAEHLLARPYQQAHLGALSPTIAGPTESAR